MFWVEQGELRARIDKPGAERLTASRFEKVADDIYRDVSGRERGELLRVTRAADGVGHQAQLGDVPLHPRADRLRRARSAADLPTQALLTSTLTLSASPTARSSTARRGSGTASHGPTTVVCRSRGSARTSSTAPWSPPVTSGSAPRPEDPRRVVGGRLVGLARLVVAPSGEALLALAAGLGPALHVALPDLVLDQALALEPGHGEAALAHEQHAPDRPAACAAAANEAASAGPSYDAAKGRRATNVDPSAAVPASDPSRTASVGLAVAGGEVLDPAPDAGRRHQDRRRVRSCPGHTGALGPQVEPGAVELVAAVPQGEVERDGRARRARCRRRRVTPRGPWSAAAGSP